jgi:hypothetical protein
MYGPWRNGTFADYVEALLENISTLNEDFLLHQMRYSVHHHHLTLMCLVPFGGPLDISVRASDEVAAAPGTGFFGGAAVAVMLAIEHGSSLPGGTPLRQ